ncbi:hypothetical protein ACHAXT_006267 [Thalassiosira profunda]
MSSKTAGPRRLPVLTEINICLINLAFAILHVILKPLGLEQIAAGMMTGNLFGLILPAFAIIGCFVHIVIGPLLNWALYPDAYQSIVLDNLLLWVGMLLFVNIVVALTDKSHLDVEGADYRQPAGPIGRASAAFWDTAFDYLQMSVVPWDENATLPPDRQYIFACHPHGIHCTPLGMFHRKDTAFDRRFPGICENKISGLAATVVFKLPGAREFFLSLPYIDASRSVVEKALRADRHIFVCTGSGEESLLTRRGEDVIVLSKRKGFVRLALAYGCDIVPIFGIGNSDLFKTYSIGEGLRMRLHKALHISIPIFHGRWLTTLPYRVPGGVRVLVGEPLKVPTPKVRGERPDDALVEEYLRRYIERVKELHKQHGDGRKLRIL